MVSSPAPPEAEDVAEVVSRARSDEIAKWAAELIDDEPADPASPSPKAERARVAAQEAAELADRTVKALHANGIRVQEGVQGSGITVHVLREQVGWLQRKDDHGRTLNLGSDRKGVVGRTGILEVRTHDDASTGEVIAHCIGGHAAVVGRKCGQ